MNDDIPKYRKKKHSSTSKSDSKSKHKHDYSKECLLITAENGYPYYARYCSVCGKIEDIHFFETEKIENGYCRMLSNDEVFEKYKDLEKVYMDDLRQKYVAVGGV